MVERKLDYTGKIFILILIILFAFIICSAIHNRSTTPEPYDNTQDIKIIVTWSEDSPIEEVHNLTINIGECDFDYINNTAVCVIRK